MSIETTYTHARAHLAELCDAAAQDRQIIIIRRRNAEDVALIAADELSSLLETAHLLRSPRNAERLLRALARVRERGEEPMGLSALRREVGLEESAP
ncbi:MAG: type II toxin-antitoxin system prevent-host-death family antitoxin [Truepera sp.]|nr:type II toxin-antitoxin system prevent-host-death family antitoxin [Truepera sp.]